MGGADAQGQLATLLVNLLPPLWVLLVMAAVGLGVIVLGVSYFPLWALGGIAFMALGLASWFGR